MADDLDADQWLVARLTGDATLMGYLTGGFHLAPAPEASETIAATYQTVAVPDTGTNGGGTGLYRGVWDILVWWDNAGAVADVIAAVRRIHTLLHEVVTATSPVLHVHRDGPSIRPTERIGDRTWRARGGRYRWHLAP